MADTKSLLATRGAWTEAVAAGETDLPHKEWYEQMIQQRAAAAAEEKKGFDSVANNDKG